MYDVTIIGRDLSSLIAGLTSVHHGLKTVLVTERDPDEAYREGNYTFYPNPLPLACPLDPQLVRDFLEDPQLFLEETDPEPSLDPAFQVILPGHRLDILSDHERLNAELIREFPEEADNIRSFNLAVEKGGSLVGCWMRKDKLQLFDSLLRAFRRIGQLLSLAAGSRSFIFPGSSHGLAFWSVVEAELAMLSALDVGQRKPPLSAAYLLSLPRRGRLNPVGDRNAWMRLLYRKFEESGGVLFKNCEIIRIDTDKDIVVDLEGADGSLKLDSRRLIVSTQWEKMNGMLLEQPRLRRLKHRLKSVVCAGYPFSLHMGVREGSIPERLTPHAVVVLDEKRPVHESNLVFLDTSLPAEPGRAPAGGRAITATVYLPESPLRIGDDELKHVASMILVSLEGLLPFLRENIDFINVERSIAFSRTSQETVGLKYNFGISKLFGLNTFSPKTPLPHLFLTGGMLRAGLGFEGEILSGIEAALLAGVVD